MPTMPIAADTAPTEVTEAPEMGEEQEVEEPVAEVEVCVYADGRIEVKQGEESVPARNMDEAISVVKQILTQAVEVAPGGEAQAMSEAYAA